jgi:deoxycytidine triphosphate deaminase
MLLSDRDIVAAIKAQRLGVEPFTPELIQPSSVDVRLDRWFRVFNNQKYTHIDPSQQQDELTALTEVPDGEPFVLHPGEFVLGSTLEVFTLPNDLAARLEGKALSVHTPIPTPRGWREMGDLRVGQQVFDERGAPCTILRASPIMYGRECLEVEFSDGSTIVADAEHQWVTRTKSERRYGKPASIRTTREIAETVRTAADWNHHVMLAGAAQYPTQLLPVDPYVLGVWLGDGTSNKAEITVGAGDEQVLEEIARAGYQIWPSSGNRAFRVGGIGRGHTLRLRDKAGRYQADSSLSSTLKAMGLHRNKHVPVAYLHADIDQRLALLQGLMDSDGHIDESGRCEFVNTNERIADAVVELAASLGLRPKKRRKRVTLYGVEQRPAFQVKFAPRIEVFRLGRKLARLRQSAGHAFRAIVAVRPVLSRPVRCIEVSTTEGMFLAGTSYIPTHNSSLGRLGLLTHSTAGFIDPGFSGHVTLELSNVANLPITLWPGMKIGQLCLFALSSPSEHPYGSAIYGSRYQGQRGPTPSRSWQSWRTWPTSTDLPPSDHKE